MTGHLTSSTRDDELIGFDTVDYEDGSMGTATGNVLDGDGVATGGRVTIAVDWRPLRGIAAALAAGERPVAVFASWAVIRRRTPDDVNEPEAHPRGAWPVLSSKTTNPSASAVEHWDDGDSLACPNYHQLTLALPSPKAGTDTEMDAPLPEAVVLA